MKYIENLKDILKKNYRRYDSFQLTYWLYNYWYYLTRYYHMTQIWFCINFLWKSSNKIKKNYELKNEQLDVTLKQSIHF